MRVREVIGAALVLAAFVALYGALTELRGRDYLGAILLVITGLSLLGAGTEILRPTTGE
jgi:hypothetical protein